MGLLEQLQDDPLQGLQEDVTAYLLGSPATAQVPYSAFRKLVVESAEDEAQAAWKIRVDGKVGLAGLVMMPSATPKYPNVPGPQYGVNIIIRTFEDPKVNNIGLSAEGCALANLKWLDGTIFEGLTQLYGDPHQPAVRPNYEYPGLLVYDTSMFGEMPQDMLERTPDVRVSDNGAGLVTLACSDGAAVIYFSQGATPGAPAPSIQPGNNAQIYAGPFAVPAGTLVRFMAWNPTKLASSVGKGVVNIP